MLGLILSFIVVVWVAYFVFKKYPPQPVLFVAGFAMMIMAIVFGMGEILPAKQSTGSAWMDMVQFVSNAFSNRAAKLGMIIMIIGGFSKYMDAIGASSSLVRIAVKPLQKVGRPYLVLGLTSIISNVLCMFISSASGLALLLMVTMYPVLVRLGVSRLAACAVIATSTAPGWGPAGVDSIYAAELAGMEIIPYFINYQVPVCGATVLVLAAAHMYFQRYYDMKNPDEMAGKDVSAKVKEDGMIEEKPIPGFYALLPTIPLFVVLFFGLVDTGIKMDIVLATLLSVIITMIVEILRHRNMLKLFQDIKAFWDGMGAQMAMVVTLVVAAETFSKGLLALGAIDTLINSAQGAGFGGVGMMFVFVAIIIIATIVTGSGNAVFFAFAPLAPKVAALSNTPSLLLLMPMNIISNMARPLSPIAAVMLVVSGAANINPIDLVKRTLPPIVVSIIVNIGLSLLMF